MPAIDTANFEIPNHETALVWRYMPYEAFDWMVRRKALFLPAAHLLKEDDQFEGSIPKQDLHKLLEETTRLAGQYGSATAVPIEIVRRSFNKTQRESLESCVSCWHMRDNESTAMWKIYGSHKASVAIVTDYGSLRDLFDSRFLMGKVDYVEFEEHRTPFGEGPVIPGAHFLVLKRKEYEHENEVRVILEVPLPGQLGQPKPGEQKTRFGLIYPLNDFEFIRRVVVHPHAASYVFELVNEICAEHDLPKAERSVLARKPIDELPFATG